MRTCTIILPCYKPKGDWHIPCIKNFEIIQKQFSNTEFALVIVNDQDQLDFEDKFRIIRAAIKNSFLINYGKNKGKGFAIRSAVHEFDSDFYLYTDYDWPYEILSVKNILSELFGLENGAIIGIRSRTYYDKIPSYRKIISIFLKSLNRFILKLPTYDTQAGLKGFSVSQKELFLSIKTNGFLFDLEFLKKIASQKHPYKLIQINLRPDVHLSNITIVNLIKEFYTFLRILLR